MDLLLLAAEGGNPTAVNYMPLIATVVVFGLFFFVLSTKVWPKITNGLDERDRKIRDEIKSAEDARAEAEKAKAEFEEALTNARREASEMIAKAKGDAQAAANDLKARNEAQVAEMKQRASSEIESAKQAAILELRAEAANLATVIAGKILEREISVTDQQRLVEESLAELGAVSRN